MKPSIGGDRIAAGPETVIEMEIVCRCSSCGAKFKVDVRHAGMKVPCIKCGGAIVVPPLAAPLDDEPVIPDRSANATSTGSSAKTPLPSAGLAKPVEAKGRDPQPVSTGSTVRKATLPAAQERPVPQAAPSEPQPRYSAPQTRPKDQYHLLKMAGGAALAVAVLLGCVYGIYVAWRNTQPPLLVIDWPIDERDDAALQIDRKQVPRERVKDDNPLTLPVAPGKHRIAILRRGFEPVVWELSLQNGDRHPLRPSWTALAIPDTPPAE